jgi:hypothetical protein
MLREVLAEGLERNEGVDFHNQEVGEFAEPT